MTPSIALARLRACTRAERSGEFICASESTEVHVFLQRGRVAWATDSAHPRAFTRTLKQRAEIDDESFRLVLEACNKDSLPLGETLVGWGLASWDVISAALREQIDLALRTLASFGADAQTIFLDRRRFAEYDDRLTFALSALLENVAEAPLSGRAEVAPLSEHGRAEAMLRGIRGATWTLVLEAGQAVETAGAADADASSTLSTRTLLGDGADFVALRWSHGSLLGTMLEREDRQLWCRLSADANYGAAVAAISALAPKQRPRYKPGSRRSVVAWQVGGSDWRAPELRHALELGDILAVALASPCGEILCASGTSAVDQATVERIVRRRREALSGTSVGVDEGPAPISARSRTLVTGEERLWCYGADIVGESGEPSLWVLAHREVPQSVGWASLARLSRSIGPIEGRV